MTQGRMKLCHSSAECKIDRAAPSDNAEQLDAGTLTGRLAPPRTVRPNSTTLTQSQPTQHSTGLHLRRASNFEATEAMALRMLALGVLVEKVLGLVLSDSRLRAKAKAVPRPICP